MRENESGTASAIPPRMDTDTVPHHGVAEWDRRRESHPTLPPLENGVRDPWVTATSASSATTTAMRTTRRGMARRC